MWAYLFVVSWLSVGAISFVLIDKMVSHETRAEYVGSMAFFTVLGYISIILAIGFYVENSEWWQEPINKNGE